MENVSNDIADHHHCHKHPVGRPQPGIRIKGARNQTKQKLETLVSKEKKGSSGNAGLAPREQKTVRYVAWPKSKNEKDNQETKKTICHVAWPTEKKRGGEELTSRTTTESARKRERERER